MERGIGIRGQLFFNIGFSILMVECTPILMGNLHKEHKTVIKISDDVTSFNSSWYKTFKNHFLGRRLHQELKSNLGTYLFEKKVYRKNM